MKQYLAHIATGTGASLFAGGAPGLCPLAAQAPAELGNWILSLGVILALVATVVNMIVRLKRKPPIDATFMTKAEGKALRDETKHETEKLRHALSQKQDRIFTAIEDLRREIKSDNRSNAMLAEERIKKIHERINTLAEAFSEHRGAVTAKLNTLHCSATGSCKDG